MDNAILHGIDKDIEEIFYNLISIKSDTGTQYEKQIEPYFMSFFNGIDYFNNNPHLYGKYPIKEDILERSVLWALLKGEGDNTIVFINHYDVVDVEDYKALKEYAYTPYELEKQLFKIKDELPAEAKRDLESGKYIFGRGTADMKAGAAIQMALIKRYTSLKSFKGNILYLSLPDEENMSAGMRSGVILLKELKEKYKLKYIITINSEPHQRIDESVGVLSEGSVGKIMPFIYVRGSLSHVGKVFEGFNPVGLMAKIISKIELSLDFSDFIEGEASPPPSCLYIRDSKMHYDVSMPLSAGAYFSIQTLNRDPASVMETLKRICLLSFKEIIEEMNEKFKIYKTRVGKSYTPLPWEPKVVTFEELCKEAYNNYGVLFMGLYDKILTEIKEKIQKGEKPLINSNFELTDRIFDYIDDLSPRVVIGFAPPYYPNVSNINIKNLEDGIKGLSNQLIDFAYKNYNQKYEKENYFTGISDLSYTYIENSQAIIKALEGNMPFYNNMYTIPLDIIEEVSAPCINIGPWGKDFHKLTERVLKEDLFKQTPGIIDHAVSTLFT